jgi:transcriptional regulator with XRE-family HTH domain
MLVGVDLQHEISEFLISRRARLTPVQAGLPWHSANRRVPGLRREEVALIAGVSVDYYIRLERGKLNGVSDSVLDALARALQLDDAERAYLLDLAMAAQSGVRSRSRPTQRTVRTGVRRILEAMTGVPALVRNRRMDIVAANRLGRALYAEMFDSDLFDQSARPANSARFVFLEARATSFFGNWKVVADDVVALLRSEAGRDPYDPDLTDLVRDLSAGSEAFRSLWAVHDVRFHNTSVKSFRHSVVGDLTLAYESMALSGDRDLTLLAYTAEPGSKSGDALKLLANLDLVSGSASRQRAPL